MATISVMLVPLGPKDQPLEVNIPIAGVPRHAPLVLTLGNPHRAHLMHKSG